MKLKSKILLCFLATLVLSAVCFASFAQTQQPVKVLIKNQTKSYEIYIAQPTGFNPGNFGVDGFTTDHQRKQYLSPEKSGLVVIESTQGDIAGALTLGIHYPDHVSGASVNFGFQDNQALFHQINYGPLTDINISVQNATSPWVLGQEITVTVSDK